MITLSLALCLPKGLSEGDRLTMNYQGPKTKDEYFHPEPVEG